jgi:hypothetical protein
MAVRTVIGVLVIGGVLSGLWFAYGPRTAGPSDDDTTPAPRLADANAVVRVSDGSGIRRASISCSVEHRTASGFWAADAVHACDALASTRGALLSGPGCARIGPRQVGLSATGSFGARSFEHRAVRGGCPDGDAWLDVNALASPVLGPDQELEPGGLTAGPDGLGPR